MSDEPDPEVRFEDAVPVAIEKVADASPPPVINGTHAKPASRLNGPFAQLGEPLEMPFNNEAERQVLAYVLIDGEEAFKKCDAAKINSDSFYEHTHRTMFRRLERMRAESKPIGLDTMSAELKAHHEEETAGGEKYIWQCGTSAPTTLSSGYYIERLRESATLREVLKTLGRIREETRSFDQGSGSIDDFLAEISTEFKAITAKTSSVIAAEKEIRAKIDRRRFNIANQPKNPTPRFLINGIPTSTPGNLGTIISQAKSGKSALIGGAISAAIVAAAKMEGRDNLGFTAESPGSRILIHIDTEQSQADHDKLVRTALRRAGVSECPDWLWSFGCAGFSAAELRQTLALLAKDAVKAGGLFAIILDGTGDFVNDVNDPKETTPFIAELHSLAIECDCPILNVIHENPGAESGKMRGHLGSQMERKAESNIRLKKTDGITVVFSEKMRGPPIMEKDGPRFSWDNESGMHMSCQNLASSRDDAKRDKLVDVFEAVVVQTGKERFRFAELVKAIGDVTRTGASAAEDRFSAMKKLGVITKDMLGFWGAK